MRNLPVSLDTPPLLAPLLEKLIREGLYHTPEDDATPSQKDSTPTRAIRALNEAYRQMILLYASGEDLAQAAHALERIQVVLAQVEKEATTSHHPKAMICWEMAERMALLGRELFHEMKLQKRERENH